MPRSRRQDAAQGGVAQAKHVPREQHTMLKLDGNRALDERHDFKGGPSTDGRKRIFRASRAGYQGFPGIDITVWRAGRRPWSVWDRRSPWTPWSRTTPLRLETRHRTSF